MTKKQFYFLEEDYRKNYANLYNKTKNYERKICEKCGGVEISYDEELEIDIEGDKKGNFYSARGHFFIDSKFYKVLNENNILGFEVKEIGNFNKSNDDIKEMIITGEGGFLRNKNGKIFEKCDRCNKVLENYDGIVGTIICKEDYKDYDVFVIKNYRGIPVVTQKFKDVCEKNKIKNVYFTSVEEFELG